MEDSFYVYCLRRLDMSDPFDIDKACPFYVGKGCNGRYLEHRKEAERLRCTPGRKSIKIRIIHKLWKHGLDFIEEIIVDNLTEDEAFELEIDAIEIYGRININTGCLANLTDGGEGCKGIIPWNLGIPRTDEVKERLRLANLGKRLTEEHKQNISNGCKGKTSWIKGKKHKLETIEKIRETLLERGGNGGYWRGREFTEQHKRNIGNAVRGKSLNLSDEERQRRSDSMKSNKKFLGRTHTEETKDKLRQINLGREHTEETRQKMRDAKAEGFIPWNKGKHHTEETKAKISKSNQERKEKGFVPWNKGKKHSPESIEKMRQAKLGENNPNFGKSTKRKKQKEDIEKNV